MAVDLGEQISTASRSLYQGDGFRQQAPRYDPMSGEGARMQGGRFNPPASFAVLYLCSTRACAVAEFLSTANRHPIGPAAFLPRVLYRYEIALSSTLDLTDPAILAHLGMTAQQLVDDDWSVTQDIGRLAHEFGYQAVANPSATDTDTVLAIFTENMRNGTVIPTLVEEWNALDSLDP